MSMLGVSKTLVTTLLGVGLFAAGAHAGAIASFGGVALPGGSTSTIGPAGPAPAPNNDNTVAASPNAVNYTVFLNALGIADVEFIVGETGGTTEYRIAQTLINNSGQPWIGYRYELGYGTGAAFVRSAAGDGLDFDAPDRDPVPSSNRFTLLDHGEDLLVWSGGTAPLLAPLVQSFAIDVPDGLGAVNPSGLGRFTLRQVQVIDAAPAVPAPASLALLGGALAGGLAVRRTASRR